MSPGAAINKYFPTLVYSYEDIEFAKKMLPIAKKYLENPNYVNLRFGYKSTYALTNLSNLPQFNEFNQYVHSHVSSFHKVQGYEPITNPSFFTFASKMESGDFHELHTHPGAKYSFVFYLSVPENSSPIIFYDPRPYTKFLDKKIQTENDLNRNHAIIKPKEGLLLLWEAWLEHKVPPNKCDGERITLVCNIA